MSRHIEANSKLTLAELGIEASEHTGKSLTLDGTEFPWLKSSKPLIIPLVRATLFRVKATVLLGSAVSIGTLTDKQSKGWNATIAYNEGLAQIVTNQRKGVRNVGEVGSGNTIYQIGGNDANSGGLIIFSANIAPELVPEIKGTKYRTFVKVAFSTNQNLEETIAKLIPNKLKA